MGIKLWIEGKVILFHPQVVPEPLGIKIEKVSLNTGLYLNHAHIYWFFGQKYLYPHFHRLYYYY
jgi:hypothetical protein